MITEILWFLCGFISVFILDECMRVLEDYGILIFKWSETSIKKKELLKVLEKEHLFGHPNGSRIGTHWFCFIKRINQKKE